MKKGLTIVGVVGACSAFELVFLFGSLIKFVNSPGWLWTTVIAANGCSITGLAILFARYCSLSKGLRFRLLEFVSIGLGAPFAMILGGTAITLVTFLRLRLEYAAWAAVTFAICAVVAYPPLRFLIRNPYTLDKGRAVADWVRCRQSESTADRNWKRRGTRIASVVPVFVVLIVHVFFFGCLRVAFRAGGGVSCRVGGYTFKVPASAILFVPNFGDGDDRGEYPVFDALTDCSSIARLPFGQCAAHWSVGLRPLPQIGTQSYFDVSTREKRIENAHEDFRCVESWGYGAEPANFLSIDCDAQSQTRVTFGGPRDDADTFYNFVKNLTWRP